MRQFRADTAITIEPRRGCKQVISVQKPTATTSVIIPRNLFMMVDRKLLRLLASAGNCLFCSLKIETGRFMNWLNITIPYFASIFVEALIIADL